MTTTMAMGSQCAVKCPYPTRRGAISVNAKAKAKPSASARPTQSFNFKLISNGSRTELGGSPGRARMAARCELRIYSPAEVNRRGVGIFWDIEACGLPNPSAVPPDSVPENIVKSLALNGIRVPITAFNVYGEDVSTSLPETFTECCRASGIEIINTKDSAEREREMFADMIIYSRLSRRKPRYILLIYDPWLTSPDMGCRFLYAVPDPEIAIDFYIEGEKLPWKWADMAMGTLGLFGDATLISTQYMKVSFCVPRDDVGSMGMCFSFAAGQYLIKNLM